MITESSMKSFRASLGGQSFCPVDAGYDQARKIPNAMIDRHPAIIARCTGPADVIACVRFAREHDLVLAVRGGGHSVAGKSVCEGGLVIDLSAMKGIRVDPGRRTVRAQTGLTLGEFDRETQAFGLATTQGVVSTVGIAGLTLGGGWGHLHAKYGLAIDNLISADIVTAEGNLLTASAAENEDLFWGIRGGSGNFGVVTSLEYRLHPVGSVLAGGLFWPTAKAKEVLHFWREFAESSPDELVTQGTALTLPGVGPVFGIVACYAGSISSGEEVLKPLRSFGAPIADSIAEMSYAQLQTMLNPFFPPGRHTYVKSNFVRDFSDAAIDAAVEYVGRSPSPYTFAPFFEHWHGAATRIGSADTAFPHRQHSWNFFAWSTWEEASESERNIRWTRECWQAMRPFLVAGSYSNYVSDEGEAVAREAYGPNYDHLSALKAKYDPTNFFHMNHNVQPRATSARISA